MPLFASRTDALHVLQEMPPMRDSLGGPSNNPLKIDYRSDASKLAALDLAMSPVPVIVISTPGARRFTLMADHLRGFGISPELSPSVFIESNPEDVHGYEGRRRLQELGYHLTKGEIGCFLAHRDAWKKVVDAGVPCLVLEDDARLDAKLVAHLESAAQAIAGSTMMVRLFSMKSGRHKRWKVLSSEFSLVRPLAAASSAVAYLMSPGCAAALLEHSAMFWLAVDEFMDDEADHGCVVMQGYPQLVQHDDEGASMVGGRKKPPLSLGRKILREIARVRRNLSQALNRERTLWRLGLRP